MKSKFTNGDLLKSFRMLTNSLYVNGSVWTWTNISDKVMNRKQNIGFLLKMNEFNFICSCEFKDFYKRIYTCELYN